MQNLSVRFMVPSHACRNLTQPMRVSERKEFLFLPLWRTGTSLYLLSHQKNIFLKTMQYNLCSILMVWGVILNIFWSFPINIVHSRTVSQKSSGTKSRIITLKKSNHRELHPNLQKVK